MKRKVIISIAGLGLVFIVFVVYKILTFSIFDVEIKEISMVDVPNKNFKIGIYYLPSNATSQDYIQVRKIENDVEHVIENFEKYNFVVKSDLMGDSVLSLILKDSIMNVVKQDTFFIKLK